MAAPQAEPATAVLVVDDEPLVLRFTERVLADAGYRVQSAADGIRALELVGPWSIPPDLLITDLRMPGLNGCELARRISAIHPSVRVLLVSAADPEHLERAGRSCGSLSHPRHCSERSSSSSGQALVGEQAKAKRPGVHPPGPARVPRRSPGDIPASPPLMSEPCTGGLALAGTNSHCRCLSRCEAPHAIRPPRRGVAR